MKTYYDLTQKERKEYEKDFKKTPVGREMNIISSLIGVVALIFFLTGGIISMFADGGEEFMSQSSLMLMDVLGKGFYLILIVNFCYNFYTNINFTAWLKNKHDIKRW